METKMRVAVIGGSGFIGSEIVKLLLSEGHEVIVADRNKSTNIIGNEIHFTCDICNIESLYFLKGVEEVYNMAGVLGTSELESQIYDAVRVNILGATNVFEAANRFGVKRLFYPSKPNVWRNVYTVTKEASEEIAKRYNENFPTRICSLRLFNAYGSHQHLVPIRKIVPVFAAQARFGLPIQIWGNGKQTVDLIYANDIAKIVVDYTRLGCSETLDLGRGIPLTVLEVAEMVNKYFGNKSGVQTMPMRVGETPDTFLVADISKLKAKINVQFSDLEKSMDETLSFYKNLPEQEIKSCLEFYGII